MAEPDTEASSLLACLDNADSHGATAGCSGVVPSRFAGVRRYSKGCLVATALMLLVAALCVAAAASHARGAAAERREDAVQLSAAAGAALAGEALTAYDAAATVALAKSPFLCTGAAASLPRGRGDGVTWRCSAGACIHADQRCDGRPHCLDHSDERACEAPRATSGAAPDQAPASSASPAEAPSSSTASPAPVPSSASASPAPAPLSSSASPAPAPSSTSASPAPAPSSLSASPAPAPPGSSSSNSISFPLASGWQPQPPAESAGGTDCTERGGYAYDLVWKAQGSTFFENFNYLLNDANSGAVQYLAKEEATQKQVTVAYDTHAILRAGPKGSYFKRTSAKLETKVKWTYFLMVAKFNHVPWGCGLWPALWTHSPEAAWPDGGELDILEYANEIGSRSSFHVGLANKCQLDEAEFRKPGCRQYPDAEFNFTGDYQCVTHYPDMIGCAPNHLPLLSGEQLSRQPFVVAAEWTPSFVKIFRIPAAEAPADVTTDQPQPDEWDRWLSAYYPFAASERNRPGSCPDPERLMKAQQLVLSLGFCGDWAAKVWLNSTCANTKGPALPSQCVAVDPHNPMGEVPNGPRDCCSAFIYDEKGQYGTEEYLSQHGYFNVSWIKVFQHSGRRLDDAGNFFV